MTPIEQATRLIKNANAVTVLTGAGISAESGIPTFRDKQTGLWENYNAEELASQAGFRANPKLVWQWYQMRRRSIIKTQPNSAHIGLHDIECFCHTTHKQFTLISQNVDELHEQAGSTPLKVHGNIMKNHCNDCGQAHTGEYLDTDELIHCQYCDGLIRPSVVWFGEGLPTQIWHASEQATANCDLFISIGTSSMVYPAAGLIHLAKQNDAQVIELNPNPTQNTAVNVQIADKAGVALPAIIKSLEGLKSLIN